MRPDLHESVARPAVVLDEVFCHLPPASVVLHAPVAVRAIPVVELLVAVGGGVSGCPDPSMLILLADDTWVAAGDLQVGMVVKTQHENTFAWGNFNVTAKSIMTQPKLEVVFDSKKVIVSESHRFWVDNRTAWINTKDVEVGDVINGLIVREINDVGEGPVVRITVDEAHTYIMEDLLSHNVKMLNGEFLTPGSDAGSGGWGSYDGINRFMQL